MSIASRITDYLTKLPPDEDYVPLDMNKVAADLKMPRDAVTKHLSAMGSKGRIEFVKDEGRHIIGFRNLQVGDRRKRVFRQKAQAQAMQVQATQLAASPIMAPLRRRLVSTPELDRIAEARAGIEQFVERFAGLVDEARARESLKLDPEKVDAYATEGLGLLERNQWLEKRNSELREQLTQAERELGYLKAKNDEKLREGLVSAGVVHSNPND